MFRLVMENSELCQKVLELVLGFKISKIEYLEVEKDLLANLKSKGVRLDIYVEDADGNAYDLEMQVEDTDGAALGKRSRYYQSMIDQNLLSQGRDYYELRRSIVIFICQYDPFGYNHLKYTFTNRCHEQENLQLEDASSKIFINTRSLENKYSKALLNFIYFINTGESKDAFTRKLQIEVEKQHMSAEKAVTYMTLEEYSRDEYRRGHNIGKAEGIAQGMLKQLFELVADGTITLETAAKKAKLSPKEFQKQLNNYIK